MIFDNALNALTTNITDFELPKSWFTLNGAENFKNIRENCYTAESKSNLVAKRQSAREDFVHCQCTVEKGCGRWCENRQLYM
jgi:hypothetical protein